MDVQSLARCSIYRDKYSIAVWRQNVDSPFEKYAVLATYLEPNIHDYELVSALQFHFPPFIHWILATGPLQTVQDAVDVLKRLDRMDDHEPAPRPNPVSQPRTNP